MTIDLTTENVHLAIIVFLLVMQMYQWYSISLLRKQMVSTWMQIAIMAAVMLPQNEDATEQDEKQDNEK
jgi:Gpi18-like mannosyltransferase